ncbi:DoxX family protein [Ureibacillus sp. MALMAid1270]|uniref:DoxX family protein n=1 Tax=Ureibacillus sp. MALMAid1270 TaxID=3411629 RepID=UPI003BA3FF31
MILRANEFGGFLIRVVLGVTFLLHGLAKYQEGVGVIQDRFLNYNIPYADYVAIGVIFVEVLGGVFMIIGFTTRFIAALFTIIMIGAITFVKFDLGFLQGYELDVILMAMSLCLLIAGSRFLALDNFFVDRKKKK